MAGPPPPPPSRRRGGDDGSRSDRKESSYYGPPGGGGPEDDDDRRMIKEGGHRNQNQNYDHPRRPGGGRGGGGGGGFPRRGYPVPESSSTSAREDHHRSTRGTCLLWIYSFHWWFDCKPKNAPPRVLFWFYFLQQLLYSSWIYDYYDVLFLWNGMIFSHITRIHCRHSNMLCYDAFFSRLHRVNGTTWKI